MADQPDWVPPGIDTQRANVARVYDYCLGGSHNFLADQDSTRPARSSVKAASPARSGSLRRGRPASSSQAVGGSTGTRPNLVGELR